MTHIQIPIEVHPIESDVPNLPMPQSIRFTSIDDGESVLIEKCSGEHIFELQRGTPNAMIAQWLSFVWGATNACLGQVQSMVEGSWSLTATKHLDRVRYSSERFGLPVIFLRHELETAILQVMGAPVVLQAAMRSIPIHSLPQIHQSLRRQNLRIYQNTLEIDDIEI